MRLSSHYAAIKHKNSMKSEDFPELSERNTLLGSSTQGSVITENI